MSFLPQCFYVKDKDQMNKVIIKDIDQLIEYELYAFLFLEGIQLLWSSYTFSLKILVVEHLNTKV